jgi:membrane fusion protein YbhG
MEVPVAPKGKSRLKLIVLIVVIAAGAIALLLYMRKQREPKPLVLSGTLEARTVNVGSLVGGRVTRVLIDEGSHVTAGQVIVTLETETLDRQIAQQQAAIEAARAAYAKALAGPRPDEVQKAAAIASNDEKDRRRMEALFHDGIVARQVYDDAATKARASSEDLQLLQKGTRKEDIEAARAQVEQQQRQLGVLQKQRSETDVKSSVTGIVQSFGLRPGDLVAPNQTVAEIIEESQLWVRVYVPETMLGLLHVNQAVKVTVDTYPNQSFNGTISTIASQGEYTPRNVQTRAQRAEQVFAVKVLVAPDPKLHAGMAATVDTGVMTRAGQ